MSSSQVSQTCEEVVLCDLLLDQLHELDGLNQWSVTLYVRDITKQIYELYVLITQINPASFWLLPSVILIFEFLVIYLMQAIGKSPQEQPNNDSDHCSSGHEGSFLDDFSDVDSADDEVANLFGYVEYFIDYDIWF